MCLDKLHSVTDGVSCNPWGNVFVFFASCVFVPFVSSDNWQYFSTWKENKLNALPNSWTIYFVIWGRRIWRFDGPQMCNNQLCNDSGCWKPHPFTRSRAPTRRRRHLYGIITASWLRLFCTGAYPVVECKGFPKTYLFGVTMLIIASLIAWW